MNVQSSDIASHFKYTAVLTQFGKSNYNTHNSLCSEFVAETDILWISQGKIMSFGTHDLALEEQNIFSAKYFAHFKMVLWSYPELDGKPLEYK